MENENGQVAMVYRPRNQKYVQVGKSEYIFSVRRSISFAWVDRDDVAKLLLIHKSCGCANGSTHPAFRLATDQEYRLWTGIADR